MKSSLRIGFPVMLLASVAGYATTAKAGLLTTASSVCYTTVMNSRDAAFTAEDLMSSSTSYSPNLTKAQCSSTVATSQLLQAALTASCKANPGAWASVSVYYKSGSGNADLMNTTSALCQNLIPANYACMQWSNAANGWQSTAAGISNPLCTAEQSINIVEEQIQVQQSALQSSESVLSSLQSGLQVQEAEQAQMKALENAMAAQAAAAAAANAAEAASMGAGSFGGGGGGGG